MNYPHDWIVPEWPAPTNVNALITTRNGGVSQGSFASLNLGLRTRDDPAAVAENRAYLRRLLPQEPKWLTQVHGATVIEVDGLESPPEADASIGRQPGTVCAVMIADCVPVLFTDWRGTLVAVAHVGWRGLVSGVLENTVRAMNIEAAKILAYMGPGIGPHAFEVGADVRDAFLARDAGAATALAAYRPGKWLADLYALVRQTLGRAGVTQVYGGGYCTVSDDRRFFSYRRDKETGRMAALIWRNG